MQPEAISATAAPHGVALWFGRTLGPLGASLVPYMPETQPRALFPASENAQSWRPGDRVILDREEIHQSCCEFGLAAD